MSWSWALLKEPVVQLLKNFPAFYGTRGFFPVFTRALHWSLSWARSIQSGRLSKESIKFRRPLWHFVTRLFFYGEELLAPRPSTKLEDHLLSAVFDCLFNIFAATLHIWRPSPLSATWGRAMPRWQVTHLTWTLWWKKNLASAGNQTPTRRSSSP
jgi:hypothetical protein